MGGTMTVMGQALVACLLIAMVAVGLTLVFAGVVVQWSSRNGRQWQRPWRAADGGGDS